MRCISLVGCHGSVLSEAAPWEAYVGLTEIPAFRSAEEERLMTRSAEEEGMASSCKPCRTAVDRLNLFPRASRDGSLAVVYDYGPSEPLRRLRIPIAKSKVGFSHSLIFKTPLLAAAILENVSHHRSPS